MAKADMKPFRKIISDRLKAYRLLSGYDTAREFAKDIDEDENTYTKWERAENMPSADQIVKMCLVLGITPNHLLWDKNRRVDPKTPFLQITANLEEEN